MRTFIITLAAIAESLNCESENISTMRKDITLSVGLPIVNYGHIKKDLSLTLLGIMFLMDMKAKSI